MLDNNNNDKKQEDLIRLVKEMRRFLAKYNENSDVVVKPMLIVDKLTGLTGYDIISMIQLLDLTTRNLGERCETFICPGENERCSDFHYNVIDKALESAVINSYNLLSDKGFNKLKVQYIDDLIGNTCEYLELNYKNIRKNIIDMLINIEEVFDNIELVNGDTRQHLNKLRNYLIEIDSNL